LNEGDWARAGAHEERSGHDERERRRRGWSARRSMGVLHFAFISMMPDQ
jgi:hypothetical protein